MRALAPSKNEVLSTNTTPSAEPSPNSSTSPCWIGASSASVTRVPSTRVATAVPSKSVTRPMATSADAAVWANWPGASGPATRATTSPSSLSPSRVVRPAGSADAKKSRTTMVASPAPSMTGSWPSRANAAPVSEASTGRGRTDADAPPSPRGRDAWLSI